MVTMPPLAPGIAPLMAMRLFSASIFHDSQILYGHALSAQVAGQLLALHYTAGVGAGAVGTGMTMNGAGTVGILRGWALKRLITPA